MGSFRRGETTAIHWAANATYWPAHVAGDGTKYDLSHLDPIHLQFSFEDGEIVRTFDVHVGFSTHTFTCEAYQAGANADRYPQCGDQRFFDIDRYTLSTGLREIVRNLDKAKCYHPTKNGGGFLTIRGDGVPAGFEYRVFFSIRHRGGNAVDLCVRSAFVGAIETAPASRRRKPVRFKVILKNTCEGKQTLPPP
jgi:hypothetical protein